MRTWMKWIGLIAWGGLGISGCQQPMAPPSPPAQRAPESPPEKKTPLLPPEPEGLPPAVAPVAVTLFFSDPNYAYLVPEKREVPPEQATPHGLLVLLSQGPREKGHESLLPDNFRCEDVTVADGTATVSLPARFENDVGGSNTALLAVQSIVYTLTEREDVQRVEFLIGGQKLTSFAGVLDLSEPQQRDETLLAIKE